MLLSACTESVDNAARQDQLPKIFPDYIGVTIPGKMAPRNLCVEDKIERIDVTVGGSNG